MGREHAGIKENAEKQMTLGIPYVKNLALYLVGNEKIIKSNHIVSMYSEGVINQGVLCAFHFYTSG